MKELEYLNDRRRELAWFFSSAALIQRYDEKRLSQDLDEIYEVAKRNGKFADDISKGFKWFAAIAYECRTDLVRTRKLAISIELGTQLDELQYEAIEAFAELDKWLLSLPSPFNADDDDDAETEQYQKALDLWNAGKLSWSQVAKDCGEDSVSWKAFSQAVKRYAEANSKAIRKGSAGRKKE